MSHRTGCAVYLVTALLLASCGGGPTGPSAPAGTDFSGHWRTSEMTYDASGVRVPFYFEFIVNASNSSIVELTMRATENPSLGNLLVGAGARTTSIPIVNSSFQLDVDNNSCNDDRGSYTFKGTFRSTANADGQWRATHNGPPGYSFCGTVSFDWTARKTDQSVPGTGLSQPGIAIAQTTPPSGGTISIGQCARSTTTCTSALKVALDVVPAVQVRSPIIEVELLGADGQRCAYALTTSSTPSSPILDSLPPNVRVVFSLEQFNFDKPTGSETPRCVPPFTTTKLRAHLHELFLGNPAVLDQTFNIVFNWTS